MYDPRNKDPLRDDSYDMDPYDREPLPPEPHKEWNPIGVDDFTARQIEQQNPLATDQDKQFAAKVASGQKKLEYLDELELRRLEDMNLSYTNIGNNSVFRERIRREREREERYIYEEQLDPSSRSKSDTTKSEALGTDFKDESRIDKDELRDDRKVSRRSDFNNDRRNRRR